MQSRYKLHVASCKLQVARCTLHAVVAPIKIQPKTFSLLHCPEFSRQKQQNVISGKGAGVPARDSD